MEILPTVEKQAPSGKDIKASVIWLHGLGADGNDFAPIVSHVSYTHLRAHETQEHLV